MFIIRIFWILLYYTYIIVDHVCSLKAWSMVTWYSILGIVYSVNLYYVITFDVHSTQTRCYWLFNKCCDQD